MVYLILILMPLPPYPLTSLLQMVLDIRGVSTTPCAGSIASININWPLLSELAKGASLALALDDPPNPGAKSNSTTTSSPSSSFNVTPTPSPQRQQRHTDDSMTARLAGLASFVLAAAVPNPQAALSLARARAAAAGTAGGGARRQGSGVRGELVKMLSRVQLMRRGLAARLAGGGQGKEGGGGGVAVKEFVVRCAMTDPQAEVYSAVAR